MDGFQFSSPRIDHLSTSSKVVYVDCETSPRSYLALNSLSDYVYNILRPHNSQVYSGYVRSKSLKEEQSITKYCRYENTNQHVQINKRFETERK